MRCGSRRAELRDAGVNVSASAAARSASWVDLTLEEAQPLRASDAVAALLTLDDGRYVMQLRDSKAGIFYPGHWGCFGGAVQPGETAPAALARELREELAHDFTQATEFSRFDFDFSALGQPSVYRIYFDIRVTQSALESFVLGEGARFEAIPGDTLLTSRLVAPYDAFAIWMHMSATRFRPSQPSSQ